MTADLAFAEAWATHLLANRRARNTYDALRFAEDAPGRCVRCQRYRKTGSPYCINACRDEDYGRAY